jgi:hypothetical protein
MPLDVPAIVRIPSKILEGTVVDNNGRPVFNARVEGKDGFGHYDGTTDVRGEFEIQVPKAFKIESLGVSLNGNLVTDVKIEQREPLILKIKCISATGGYEFSRDMRVDPVDPEVEQLLFDWSEHTKRIKTLAGKHFRSIRDFTCGAETLAEGKFYVEMPDMGRLDVGNYTPSNPKPGDTKSCKAPNGKSTELKIQLEKNHQKWVCDGKVV